MLSINANDAVNSWSTYSIRDVMTAQIIYMGCCKLTQVFSTPDARANGVVTNDLNMLITVEGIYQNKVDAIREQSLLCRNNNVTNIMAKARLNRYGTIECIETGEKFRSINEIVIKYGATASALSNHLRGKPGFVTVQSKTYRRV